MSRSGHGIPDNQIVWEAPDRKKYFLTIPAVPPADGWTVQNDAGGKPVMALYQDPNGTADAKLELSLDRAISYCASLFHYEDDVPKVYATATDSENDTVLKRPAFIITQPGGERFPYCTLGFIPSCLS